MRVLSDGERPNQWGLRQFLWLLALTFAVIMIVIAGVVFYGDGGFLPFEYEGFD